MKHLTLCASVALLALTPRTGLAQSAQATQLLRFEVKPVVGLVVSGDPAPMVISSSEGESASRSVWERSTRYSLVTNLAPMRILASLDRPMPAGTSLRVQMESGRGVSAGEVDLDGAPKEVVSAIGQGFESNRVISYRFTAGPEVAELKPVSRTVVLTLTN